MLGDEVGNGLRVIQIEHWEASAIDCMIRGDGDDVRIVRRQRLSASRIAPPHLDLGDRLALVALDQHDVRRCETPEDLVQARLLFSPQFVHDRKAGPRDNGDLVRTGFAMTEGICARLVDVEIMMGMLDG